MFSRMARKLRRQEEGATMIEYGLLAALVSIAALAALQSLGPALLNIFNQVVNAITGAERLRVFRHCTGPSCPAAVAGSIQ